MVAENGSRKRPKSTMLEFCDDPLRRRRLIFSIVKGEIEVEHQTEVQMRFEIHSSKILILIRSQNFRFRAWL